MCPWPIKSTSMSKAKTKNGNGSVDSRRQEVRQIVKNACDQLNSEGVDARNYSTELRDGQSGMVNINAKEIQRMQLPLP